MSFLATNDRIRVTDNGATVFDTDEDMPHILGYGTYQATISFPDAERTGERHWVKDHHQEYLPVCRWELVTECNYEYVTRQVCGYENVCQQVYTSWQVCGYETQCNWVNVPVSSYTCNNVYDYATGQSSYVCNWTTTYQMQQQCNSVYVCKTEYGYVTQCTNQYVCNNVSVYEEVCRQVQRYNCPYEWVYVDANIYDENYLAKEWSQTLSLGPLPYGQSINFLLIKATAVRTATGGTSQKPGDLPSTVSDRTFAFQGSALLEATGKQDGTRFLSRIISVYPDNTTKQLVLEAKHSNNFYPLIPGAELGVLRSLASTFVITLQVYFGRFR